MADSPEDRIRVDVEEDRYSRLRLIPWWDQQKLRGAKLMVVGSGALGNEVIKNCALLGIGSILVVDFDSIEESNLSRSVLYRQDDGGASKAETAAAAARELNPSLQVYSLNADVTRVGLGLFRWADVVIGGLDNIEARLAVNRACWKVGTPWVDGATEAFQGVARVFVPPDGVCFECTLSEREERFLSVRNSCGFLAREAYRQGRTPTTPTTSSVVAGIQVQEALKLLHPEARLPGLAGKGFFFDGASYDCFTISYTRRDDCLSHETYARIVQTPLRSCTATLDDVLTEARERLLGDVVLDLPQELVTKLRCGSCGSNRHFYRLLGAVDVEEAKCPDCGTLRVPEVVTQYGGESEVGSLKLSELGFGPMDILAARSDDGEVQIEISGDTQEVFGERQP